MKEVIWSLTFINLLDYIGNSPFSLRLVSAKPALSSSDSLTETNHEQMHFGKATCRTPIKCRFAAQYNTTSPAGQDTKCKEGHSEVSRLLMVRDHLPNRSASLRISTSLESCKRMREFMIVMVCKFARCCDTILPHPYPCPYAVPARTLDLFGP
jgi:hypothetical protein